MKTKLKYSVHISLKQTHSAHVHNMKSESRNSCFPRTFEKPVGFDEIDDNSWTIGLQIMLNPLSLCQQSGFLVQLSLWGPELSNRIFQGRDNLRSAGDNSSKMKFSTRCQTFRPKAGSPHASSPRILSGPSSVRPILIILVQSYVFNVADATDVRNSKRGYSPCNIGKCGTAM